MWTEGQGATNACGESAVNLLPLLSAIARSEHADAIGAREDSVVGLDRDCPDVGRDEAVVLLTPEIAVVAGSEHASAKVGSCNDVPVLVDGEGKDTSRCQSVIDLRPVVAVIGRTKHSIAITSGEKIAVRSSYQRVDAIPCS